MCTSGAPPRRAISFVCADTLAHFCVSSALRPHFCSSQTCTRTCRLLRVLVIPFSLRPVSLSSSLFRLSELIFTPLTLVGALYCPFTVTLSMVSSENVDEYDVQNCFVFTSFFLKIIVFVERCNNQARPAAMIDVVIFVFVMIRHVPVRLSQRYSPSS